MALNPRLTPAAEPEAADGDGAEERDEPCPESGSEPGSGFGSGLGSEPAPEDDPARDRDVGPKAVLDAITEPGNRKLVREHLEEIIAAEGPVEAQRLARLLGNRFELKRIQGQRQAAILGCLPRGRSSRSALGTFYWPADRSPEEYTGFRRTPPGGEKRAVAEIAPEEIGNAVVHALRSDGPCPVDDVFQTLNGVFGFNRTGREIRERWSEVVELLESSGRVVRRDGRLELP